MNNKDELAKKMQQDLQNQQNENDNLNDFVNETLNEVVNEEKTPLNALNGDINEDDDFLDEFVNAALNESLNEDDDWDFDEETEENEDYLGDNAQDDFDDDNPIEETEDDPLDNYIEDPTERESYEEKSNPVEEIRKATGDSPKNLQNLSKLGEMVLDMADTWKAQLCSAYSGQAPAEYTSDMAAKKALIEAFKEYFNSQEIKAPSPFGTLMIALALWGLPSIGTAIWHKYQLKKEEKKKAVQPQPKPVVQVQEETGEAATDYTQTKEYKENRRLFTIHKTKGTYNRTASGTFSQINVSDEYPSPEIQQLIDEGKKCPEIRNIIYRE